MESSTIITIITALAALIGATSPIVVALIQSSKEKQQSDKGILLPSNVVLHRPRLQIQWLAVFSFAILGGFVGYGGARLASSNPPNESPTMTATISIASETPASTFKSDTSTLFHEDFEDGKVQNILNISGNWQVIIDETGNKVYEMDNSKGTGYPGIEFGTTDWSNYEVKYRMRIISLETGETAIGFRRDETRMKQYQAIIDLSKIVLVYNLPENHDWHYITTRTYDFTRNVWHWVKVKAQGSELSVSVDDMLLISADNTLYNTGSIELSVWPYSHLQFDDIQVTSLKK
jgi:hypothetical protein